MWTIHLRKCRDCGHWSEPWEWKYENTCRACSLASLHAFVVALTETCERRDANLRARRIVADNMTRTQAHID